MIDDEFGWDDAKATANLAKHGVTFEMAKDAFRDHFNVEWMDRNKRTGEHRYILLGTVEARVLFVARALRDECIWMVSARGATRYERRRYHEENA